MTDDTVILSRTAYDALIERIEELEDTIVALKADPQDNPLPLDAFEMILNGTHPVTVWRSHRQMTQTSLAQVVGVGRSTISEIEAGNRQPSLAVARKIAAALQVDLDELFGDADAPAESAA